MLGSAAAHGQSTSGQPPAVADLNADVVRPAKPKTDEAGALFPRLVPGKRSSIGLVLEGGGALGLAHIGVLFWFEQNRIPVDRIAGTSMGALLGALYASGYTPADMQKLATSDLFAEIFTLQTPYDQIGYRRRQDRRDLPQAFTLGLRHGVGFRNAVLSDVPLSTLLRKEFISYNSVDGDFDHMPIPFRCVATDLNTLEPLVFRAGPLPEAVRASISIPGAFAPVKYKDHYLIDGALSDNLPTSVVRRDLQAEVVIAVHLRTASLTDSDMNSLFGLFSRALAAGSAKTERAGMNDADLLLTAETETFTTTDYGKAKELISVGFRAAEQQAANLLRYQLSEEEWQSHLRDRRSRIAPPPGRLLQVHVEGGSEAARKSVEKSLGSLGGEPIEASRIGNALRLVEGAGNHDTSFDTYHPTQQPTSAGERVPSPDTGVLVHLGDPRNGPPFLMVGGDIMAVTSNVTRSDVNFRYVHQDLGGYGSELRADARFVFLTHGSIEYYRPLFASGLFIQPRLAITRQPVYLWRNQERVSEWFQQQAGGGFDIGTIAP